MPLTHYVDYTNPTINAAWLNAIDAFYVTLFAEATTSAAARAAIIAAKSGVNTDITSLASPDVASATAVTQAANDNSTKVATTAFVKTALSNILNTVNVYTKNQSVAEYALTPGATVNTDASLANDFTLTTNQSFTLANPTNLTSGMKINFRIQQGAAGGHAITYGSMFNLPGGVALNTLTAAPNSVDLLCCTYNAANNRLECVLNTAFSH